MIVASGTRRGSALSTPSTSVQMWISSASSRFPTIEPVKSLPLRPSVVCCPCASRAMKPVTTSVSSPGFSRERFADDSVHRTIGPSGPQSTTIRSRASIQRTPLRRPRCARYVEKIRVDQISPKPTIRSRSDAGAPRITLTVCSRPAISAQSASISASRSDAASGSSSAAAMTAWRSLSAAS